MQKFFYPESVMIYGVSTSPNNMGRHTVENLERFGFTGAIYMVGRDGGELNGRRIYRQIEDIEAVPDLAVFLIPAKAIPDVLEQCGKKSIPFALIQSAGFSEFTDTNRQLEERLLEISRRWKIRFMGPNCIGTINLDNGLVLPFFPIFPDAMKKGHVSIISQSGGLIMDAARLLAFENIGVNKMLSIGNKLNLNECDYLEFLISDPETSSIGMYLENITDGRRLMDLARKTDKPVIILKANRYSTSHQIARFHTTALAGDDDIADAALKQSGIHRARTLTEMADCLKAFSLPLIKGNKVGVICRSGGHAVMLADAVHRHGFALAEFSDHIYDHVRKEIRAGVIRMTNPLDLGDVFDIGFYGEVIEKALQEPDVDGVVFGHTYLHGVNIPPTQELIRTANRLSQQYQKPVIFFMIASRKYFFNLKETADFPIFADPEQAMQALAASRWHHEYRSRHTSRPALWSGPAQPGVKAPSASAPGFMDPAEAFRLLGSYGLPVADFAVVESLHEACDQAEIIGYPVALKVAAPEILHKTEAGGVQLHLTDRRALTDAFRKMNTSRVMVQKMSPPGQEVIIGGRQDQEFGPVILFGLGGVFVEAIRDVAMRICPIDSLEARRLIEETRGFRILKGFRDRGPADLESLTNCLVRASQLLVEHPEVRNLDINPLLVFGKDGGCRAVDVKIQVG
jgi:acetate---CoA ligase (ADP-forming)